MTATVDSTLTLPTNQAAPGGEIVRTDGRQGGTRQIARAQNTLFVQHLGPIVSAGSATGTPILTGTGSVARFKVKNQTIQQTADSVEAAAWVDILVAGGTSTVTIRWDKDGGGTTTVSAALSAGARSLRLVDKGDPIATDISVIDVEVEITASTATTVEIYGVEIEYVRDSPTSITPSAAMQQGTTAFVPMDDALTDSERPLTPGVMYQMHANARYLYSRTGMAMACAYPEAAAQAAQYFVLPVPEGATSLTIWVYIGGGTPTTGNSLVIAAAGSSGGSPTISNDTWYSHTVDVTGLSSVLCTYSVGGSGGLTHAGCSAYFADRPIAVFAVHNLVDEFGTHVSDEFGNRIAGFG
jgi:hypothetical protein